MKPRIPSVPLLALALCLFGFAQAQDVAKLDEFFDRLEQKNKAMGSLAIAKDGAVLFSRSIGFSQIDGGEKTASSASTRYRIGSVTKMFTAAMILQLIEEGELDLTDTLDTYHPQVPNAELITIAQLLGHSSGVHDFTKDRDDSSWKTNPRTKDEMVAAIASGEPEFAPGEAIDYSNAGYVLLGYILETVGGKPYPEALRERITSKVGLADTYCGTESRKGGTEESSSFRYVRDWEPQAETHLSVAGGAGALISTPTDLCRFIQALFDLELISGDSLGQMMQDNFGMETFEYNGKSCYGHTGGIDNFGSWLAYEPIEKLAVAYSSNAKVYPVADIVDGVFDIYWGKPFQIPSFESLDVSPEVLDGYVGVYSNPGAPVQFVVTREGSTLFVQMSGQSAIPLEATAQDKFQIENMGMVMEFVPAKAQMVLIRRGREKLFTKGD